MPDQYLIARYTAQPRDPKMTPVKGYVSDSGNLKYTENVTVVRGLKKRDYTAQIILNLTKKTVEKSSLTTKKDFKTLFDYFVAAYANLLKS